MPESTPFFIVGSSRSGTTLLRLIIAGHSRIHIPPETWFILQLVEKLPLQRELSPAELDEALTIITGHRRWADLGLDASWLRSAARADSGHRVADVIDLIYRDLLKRAGKQRIGDKTPLYIGIVPQLATLYPRAKFIHLIRDGRDVAISFIDADFDERCYDGERFEWFPAIRKGLSYRASGQANRIMEVRYEELVTQTERTVRRICDFLDESFEDQMLEHSNRRHLVPPRGQQLHAKLARRISDESIGVWRHKLSGYQCFVMEACLHRELVLLGYPLRFAAPLWRPLLLVSGLVLRAFSPLLDRAVPFLQRRRLLPKPFYL